MAGKHKPNPFLSSNWRSRLSRPRGQFLALLYYVSRAYGMGSLSVVRPSVASIISEPTAWIPLKFCFLLPLGHMPDPFLNFWKKKYLFSLWIFFVFLDMGPYGSQNFKTLLLLQIIAESFQTFPEFLPNGPPKTTVRIFEILKLKF